MVSPLVSLPLHLNPLVEDICFGGLLQLSGIKRLLSGGVVGSWVGTAVGS